MNEPTVPIPPDITDKMTAWRKWSSRWNWMHYGLGFLSAMLSAIVAANTKHAFLPTEYAVGAAAVAAGFTFLITALSASAKGAAFETAAREIEKAISHFRGGKEKTILYDAEVRGIDILNRLK
jgi:hypothetical protein